ncbi:MAG: 16S rRNA (uracil(1498)-N(3))-methyltransferase [Myxococcota bacterium]
MSKTLIYVETARLKTARLRLEEGERRYLLKVLRLRENDALEVSDGEGKIWRAALIKIEGKFELELGELLIDEPPSQNPLTMIQCIPKGEKIKESLIQATELGVNKIMLAVSERTVARPKVGGAEKRARYLEIVKHAGSIARRSRLPKFAGTMELPAALETAPKGVKVFFWEEERARFRDVAVGLDWSAPATVVIGPEGGFSKAEAELARKAGFVTAGLGETVLRVETAVNTIISLVQFHRNKLG